MSIYEYVKVILVTVLGIYAVSRLFHFLFPETSHKIIQSFTSRRKKLFNKSPQRKSGKRTPNRRVGKPANKKSTKPKERKLSKEAILRLQRKRVAEKQKQDEERERKQKEWLKKQERLKIEEQKVSAKKQEEERKKRIQKRIQQEKEEKITSNLWDHHDRPSSVQEPESPTKTEKKALDTPKLPNKRDYKIDQTVSAPRSFDNELLFVNYDAPQKFKQSDSWSYAVAKFPEYGCVMKPPAEAKFEHRGTKEEFFERYISKRLPSELTVSGSYALPTGKNTRPFEPDIAIVYRDNSTNLFIDIEIDEPYGGISRSAIHHTEDTDDARDLYFIHRGWIVIRFAEIQIQKEPLQCAAFIAKIINDIAPNVSINSSLLSINNPSVVERWNRVQAERWAKENYREKYLGLDSFKKRDQGEVISSIEDRDIDSEVEARVKYQPNYSEDKGSGVKILKHSRDKRIRFDPIPHQYYIDGVPVKSVTSVVDQHFPTFDAEYVAVKYLRNRGRPLSDKDDLIESWNNKGEIARTKGTKLHLLIENYFAGSDLLFESDLSDEIDQFKLFLKDHQHLDPVRTEWRIFDERVRIAGTIDFLSKNSDGSYDIYDWKRSKKLVDSVGLVQNVNPYQTGFGQLRILDDTSYNKYTLQQGIYKFILESTYGINIRNMHLIVMHPRYDSYHKLEVDFMEKPIRYILGYVK